MSSNTKIKSAVLATVGMEELKRKWGWILGLGVVLAIAGTVAIGSSIVMTLFSITLLGFLMISGGILQSVHAFACKEWSGFFIDLLTGLLYIAVGFMAVANPGVTAVALTLLIALFLIFGGLFRISVSLFVKYPNWSVLLLHGVVNLLLGMAIWKQWPLSGLWVIGLFVGIDMIMNGFFLIMLGLAVKKQPDVAAVEE